MRNQNKRKIGSKFVNVLLILLLSLALTQTFQIIHGQNTSTSNQWGLSLLVENAQNVTTFAPFDQIQLLANVTYSNASQPDILVYFNVTGPQNSRNPTAITRIEMTNATGEAGFSFRLPIASENENSLVGTWQATVTIQTTDSTIWKSLNFTTEWNLETTAINTLNSKGQNQTVFSPGNDVTVQATIKNQGQAQTANITLNMQDSTDQIINQTEILNSQIASNQTTQVPATLQIPDNATAGQAAINVAIYGGTYNGTDIPAAENQTAYFTVAGNTTTLTPTPTPTTSSGPTPTPTVVENSISLFSWLLVATGLFTFTILLMFLRRKPSPKTTQTPSFAPSTPSPAAATPALALSTTPQETIQQPAPQATAPTPKIAPEKVMEATVISDLNPSETTEAQSKLAATIEVGKPDLESAPAQAPAVQTILAHVDRISGTAKRIQAIKVTLKSVREQLALDLIELNKLVDERERALKNYFETVREEVENTKTHLTDIEDTSDAAAKPDFASDLSEELISQAILTYRSRIASTEKRIQALNTVLKLEEEQFDQDVTEFNKAVDQQEKTLNNYFGILRKEIGKLQTYLTDEED
jgi:ribosomal protein L7/L12